MILYKYRDLAEPYVRDMLRSGDVCFSAPRIMNDCLDGKIIPRARDIKTEQAAHSVINYYLSNKLRIFSLSRNFTSSKMWDSYAGNGHGICLGYDVDLSSTPHYMRLIENVSLFFLEIEYKDESEKELTSLPDRYILHVREGVIKEIILGPNVTKQEEVEIKHLLTNPGSVCQEAHLIRLAKEDMT